MKRSQRRRFFFFCFLIRSRSSSLSWISLDYFRNLMLSVFSISIFRNELNIFEGVFFGGLSSSWFTGNDRRNVSLSPRIYLIRPSGEELMESVCKEEAKLSEQTNSVYHVQADQSRFVTASVAGSLQQPEASYWCNGQH